jgi:tetratricopeptide (TPR) repeat protein
LANIDLPVIIFLEGFMKIKTQVFFLVVLCIKLLVFVPQAFGQQAYNHHALEHLRRSLNFLVEGDYYNAVLASNQLIRADPNSSVNYVIRARAFFEMNDFERVIADCTQAIRLDRNNSGAFVIRGNAHAQRGDLTRAISDWEAALRLNPNIEEARQNIELARRQREAR